MATLEHTNDDQTLAARLQHQLDALVAVFLNKLFDGHRRLVATHGATMTVQHGLKILAFGLVGFAFWKWVPLVALMTCAALVTAQEDPFVGKNFDNPFG